MIEFFAEMVDDVSGDLIEKFGPYDTVGKAKAMCTRKHKATSETMMVSKFVDGEFEDDFLWPEVESNTLSEEEPQESLYEKTIQVGDTEVPIFRTEVRQFLNRFVLSEALRGAAKAHAEVTRISKPRKAMRKSRLDVATLSQMTAVERMRRRSQTGGLR